MKYILTLITLLIFIGCGQSNNDETTTAPVPVTTIEMELNKTYTVSSGDKLEKTSSDAEVSITKNTQDDITTVILLEGTAQIVRAN